MNSSVFLAGVALMLVFVGCTSPTEGDGGAPDAEQDAETSPEGDVSPSDAEAAEEGGSDAPAGGGPFTFVISRVDIVTDRLCDLDGDGIADNAVADLGEPSATLFAAAFNSGMDGALARGRRVGLHFPWIDDVAAPSSAGGIAVLYTARDTDVPVDMTDDFSGEEPFYVSASYVDACGEPLQYLEDVVVDGGILSAGSEVLFLPLGQRLPIHDGRANGELEPFGRAFELLLCGYGLIGELGELPGIDEFGGLNMLEVIVGGGAAFGVPSVPGLSPDVDVDGDGLERFGVDADGAIVSCIDGDRTTIEGRDCWEDPRIADGISFVFRMVGVGARFAGIVPGWEDQVVGTCEEGPPDPSLWDPPEQE